MPDETKNPPKVSVSKELWPILLLSGLFGLAFGGIFILIIPLSFLFWPEDPYHPLEMGLLISALFGTSAISGLILGRIIDNYKY